MAECLFVQKERRMNVKEAIRACLGGATVCMPHWETGSYISWCADEARFVWHRERQASKCWTHWGAASVIHYEIYDPSYKSALRELEHSYIPGERLRASTVNALLQVVRQMACDLERTLKEGEISNE